MAARQEKNEILAEYIKRFNKESLKVLNLQDAISFASPMYELQPGRLRWYLARNKVKTFSEAMSRAQRFIQVTDICRYSDYRSKKRKEEGNHKEQLKQQNTGGRLNRFNDHGNNPRLAKRGEIYLVMKDKSMLPHPPSIRTSSAQRDKSQWCEYHKDCGHTTKDYRELKKSLDNLADQGNLKQISEEKGKQKVHQSNSGDTEGSIRLIESGFASGDLIN